MEVSKQSLREFHKQLIELCGLYTLTDDNRILQDGKPVTIPSGNREKELRLISDNMLIDQNIAYLNPLYETLGKSDEKIWLFNLITTAPGMIFKQILITVIENALDNKDNPREYSLRSKINALIDAKTLDEINSINSNSFIHIYYMKKNKSATVQSEVFDPEYRAEFSKFRKKTWDAIEQVFTAIFGDPNELDNNYSYTATILSIPETECKLKVSAAVLRDLDQYSKDILNRDLHGAELCKHMELLEGYSALYAWAGGNRTVTVTSPQPQPQRTISAPPWGPAQGVNYNNRMNISGPIPRGAPKPPQEFQMAASIGPMGVQGYMPPMQQAYPPIQNQYMATPGYNPSMPAVVPQPDGSYRPMQTNTVVGNLGYRLPGA